MSGSDMKIVVYKAYIGDGLSPRAIVSKMEVDRVTDTSYWINGRRYARQGGWVSVVDTLEEAMEIATERLVRRKGSLANCINQVDQLLGQLSSISELNVPVVQGPYL